MRIPFDDDGNRGDGDLLTYLSWAISWSSGDFSDWEHIEAVLKNYDDLQSVWPDE